MTDTDELNRALHTHGAAWRAARPDGPPLHDVVTHTTATAHDNGLIDVTTHPSPAPRHRPPRWVAAAVAAALIVALSLVVHLAATQRADTAAPPSPSAPTRPTQVPASALPTKPRRLPGHLFVSSWSPLSTHPGDRRIGLVVTIGGGCDTLNYIPIRQTPTTVTIAPMVNHYQRAGTACAANLDGVRSYIDLDAPLGHRTLRHAPTTQP